MAEPLDDTTSGVEAVRVDIGRGSLVAVVIGAVLCALLCAAALYAAFDATETMVAVIGGFFALVFALPLLLVDKRRRVAVEIFPADPGAIALNPALLRYRREGPAPAEGLPRVRWRLQLPPFSGLLLSVGRGVQTFQPERWLGWFARPWGEAGQQT